ncbi:MAG: MBL fold metallo-hydrolase [Corallococcus sp.]|nr:MBL fold metallo-hydrolase [Corallococcus sp.]
MISFTALYSGSAGNCSLVRSDKTTVLVDAGFACGTLVHYLKDAGVSPRDVDAVLITHEHSDHISALAKWTETFDTPVYCHARLADVLRQKTRCRNLHPFDAEFSLKDIAVDFYPCSHDARYCCGYRFFDGKTYVASVTDTGLVNKELVDFLMPCATVMIESNHDENMLLRGNYPYLLKQRILSPLGHLSNAQTGEVLNKILDGSVKNIVLGHLSERNNTPELAFSNALGVIESKGMVEGKDVRLFVADQRKRGNVIE